MTIPVTAEMFIARGESADRAAALAADHKSKAGIRDVPTTAPAIPASAPRPVQSPALPQGMSAEQVGAEISSIRARRLAGEIDDRQWSKVFEPRMMELAGVAQSLKDYNAASGAQKSAILAEPEAHQTQDAFEQSIDANMEPAKSPSEYVFPSEPKSEEQLTLDRQMREAFYTAQIPREQGNRLAEEIHETSEALAAVQDDPDQLTQLIRRNAQMLRQRWGAQYEAKADVVAAFLSADTLREKLAEKYGPLLSSPATMERLFLIAQRQSVRKPR